MRLSELLGVEVLDWDGQRVGEVHDVRLVQDGPMITGFGQALRLDGLAVGEGGLFVRLGYDRHGIKGPWLLRTLARRALRRTRYVRWSDIRDIDGDRISLACAAADVSLLADVV